MANDGVGALIMERREASYECPVCGREHEHGVYVYRFDMDGVEFGESIQKGPITLHVDVYAGVGVEVDDGYVFKERNWNTVSRIMTVSVVARVDER